MDELNEHKLHLSKLMKQYTNERDQAIRNARKADSALSSLKESMKFVEATHVEKKKTRLELQKQVKDAKQPAQEKKLRGEVEQLRQILLEQRDMSANEQKDLQECFKDEEHLAKELADLRTEAMQLHELYEFRAQEREEKSRDVRTIQTKYTRLVEDIKSKQLSIQEHEKTLAFTERSLQDFVKLYDTIKEERNKCLELIQMTQQRVNEMKEKQQTFTNEADMLGNTLKQKDEQLSTLRSKHTQSLANRNDLRGSISKMALQIREQQSERDALQADINHHNQSLKLTKRKLTELHGALDRAVKMKNDRAAQLIERNEDVCILQEKIRMQEETARSGEREFKRLQDQVRFLQAERTDLVRAVRFVQQQALLISKLQNELTDEQVKFAICQEKVLQLRQLVENPNVQQLVSTDVQSNQRDKKTSETQPGRRIRELSGKDPTAAEMRQKIDHLEVLLASEHERLLECELLAEAVERLLKHLQEQVVDGRPMTLQLATESTAMRSNADKSDKRMKAITAEVQMLKIEASRLEKRVKERHELLASYQRQRSCSGNTNTSSKRDLELRTTKSTSDQGHRLNDHKKSRSTWKCKNASRSSIDRLDDNPRTVEDLLEEAL